MTAWSNELQSLDPETDYERIVYLLSVYEFSWDIEKALEFALFRTYAVPSISSRFVLCGWLPFCKSFFAHGISSEAVLCSAC